VPVCVSLATVLAGVTLSFQSQQMFVIGLLGLAGLLLAFIIQTANPSLGFAALILSAAALPLEFKGTLSFPFLIAGGLCMGWIVAALVLHRRVGLDSSRLVSAALAFGATSLVSFASGLYPWFPVPGAPLGAQVGGLALFLLSVGLFLAAGHQIRSLVQLQWLTWLFLGAGAVGCFANVFWLEFVSRWTKPESLGSLFWTWLVALSFSQALFNRQLSHTKRVSLCLLTALSIYRGLFQYFDWTSGWLPPLIALAVVLFYRFPRFTLGLALLAVPAGLFFAARMWSSLMAHEEYSYMTRLEAWGVLWQVIEKSPVVGLGPSNYFYYTAVFPFLGWYATFNSHNNYMDLLAQVGFLGLLAFSWFVFEISRMCFRMKRCLPEGFTQAYVYGAIAGLAGSLASGMLADWIIPFFYNIGIRGFRSSLLFWVFLGGVLALKRMVSNSSLPISTTSETAL
jgi:O-Antigen ligase